jgi:DNA-binding transcriptional ArsR family regulator
MPTTSRARAAVTRISDAAPLFAALGDATRLQIVARLCEDGPSSIVRLTDGSSVSRQAITKHLSALCDVGLVSSRRAGRERIWELRTARLSEVQGYLARISKQGDEALGRLRLWVERDIDEP